MQVFIIFVLIALAVSTFGTFMGPKEEMPPMEASLIGTQEVSEEEEISQEEKQIQEQIQKTVSQTKPIVWSQEVKPIIQPKEEEKKEEPIVPQVSIDTYIRYGPRKGEVIDETNKITFEFRAILSPEDTEGRISFETKVEGLEDWKETYNTKRTVTFPPGPKEYTFLVRAKIKDKDIIDPTPAKKTFKINISPYFDKVKISQVKRPDVYNNPSLITLSTYLGEEEKINITGWEFKGKNGTFLIPQGIEEFNPLVKVLPSEDIIIKKGDTIYISSNFSPLGRKDGNFRPNKCMGYLTSSRDFTIPISKNCPRITRETLPPYLERCCKEYILTLGRCELPKYQGMKDYDLFEDSNCMAYLNFNLTYGGCFATYYQDQNFLENKWHIYTNRNEREIMVEGCDTIYLRDKNGLLINKYDYGTISCKKQ